jgi:hypothetical protein
LFGFSYNPRVRTTRKRKWKSWIEHNDALTVCRATRRCEPAPARKKDKELTLCAIEIMLQKIWNGFKALG